MLLRDLSVYQIACSARNGAILGTTLFITAALGCLFYTGRIGELTSFNYWSFTSTVFRSMDQVFGKGLIDDFESKNIMRNSVGEAFTFFFLITVVFRIENPAKNLIMRLVNVLLVIVTFSRRAFLGIVIVIAGSSLKNIAGLKRGICLTLIVVATLAASLLFQKNASDSRVLDLSDTHRPEMVAEGRDIFTENPIWGTGFGAKLERGSYVHNFVVGSGAMLGIGGFLVALAIYSTVIYQFLQRLASPKTVNAAVFLVIPILGMTVGSTFEGIFTITGWLGIALYAVFEEKQIVFTSPTPINYPTRRYEKQSTKPAERQPVAY